MHPTLRQFGEIVISFGRHWRGTIVSLPVTHSSCAEPFQPRQMRTVGARWRLLVHRDGSPRKTAPRSSVGLWASGSRLGDPAVSVRPDSVRHTRNSPAQAALQPHTANECDSLRCRRRKQPSASVITVLITFDSEFVAGSWVISSSHVTLAGAEVLVLCDKSRRAGSSRSAGAFWRLAVLLRCAPRRRCLPAGERPHPSRPLTPTVSRSFERGERGARCSHAGASPVPARSNSGHALLGPFLPCVCW